MRRLRRVRRGWEQVAGSLVGVLLASVAVQAQALPAPRQPATLGYAPPQAQAQPARYQLGVRTDVVNLNETSIAFPQTVGTPAPVSASAIGRQATDPSRPQVLTPGSAGPVSSSETGRQDTATSPGPAGASPAVRQAVPDLPLAVASGDQLGQPLPPLSPSAAVRPGLPAPASRVPSLAPGSSLPAPAALIPTLPPSQPNRDFGPGLVRRDPRDSFQPIQPPAAPAPVPGPAPMPDEADPDFDPQFPPKPAPNLALKITEVVPGTAAQRAGLEIGDIIRRANGYKLESHEQLKWVIANSRGFVRLRIVNVRDGSSQVIDVRLQ